MYFPDWKVQRCITNSKFIMDKNNKNLGRDKVNGDSPDNKENQSNKKKTPAEDTGTVKKARNNKDQDAIDNDVTIGEEEFTIGEEEITIGEEEIFDDSDTIDDDIEDGPIYY